MAAIVAKAQGRLENGAVMRREEFHALYLAAPELSRIELIEGVVYMPSPVSFSDHADRQGLFIEWLAAYAAGDPTLKWSPPATVLLDEDNEPEPDAMLFRLRPGRIRGGYVAGAPELVVEVANSSASRDLHQKKRAYERNGVREYIVWRVQDGVIDWFQLHDGRFERREPGPDGTIESMEFPGLVLDVQAMLAMDREAVLSALETRD